MIRHAYLKGKIMKNPHQLPCVHCNPATPLTRSIVEPIMTISRDDVHRLAGAGRNAKAMPMSAMTFQCQMCGREWTHRVDVQVWDIRVRRHANSETR